MSKLPTPFAGSFCDDTATQPAQHAANPIHTQLYDDVNEYLRLIAAEKSLDAVVREAVAALVKVKSRLSSCVERGQTRYVQTSGPDILQIESTNDTTVPVKLRVIRPEQIA